MTPKSALHLRLGSLIIIVTLALCGIFPGLARAQVSADLPPRPTAEPTPPATETTRISSPSSFIRLVTTFPASWPWHDVSWQSLHTQAQWQTAEGTWIDVKGWYGAHDGIEIAADGTGAATETWWVAPGDFGAGPFRWLVRDQTDTELLAASTPFTLPVRNGQTVVVELALPPQ